MTALDDEGQRILALLVSILPQQRGRYPLIFNPPDKLQFNQRFFILRQITDANVLTSDFAVDTFGRPTRAEGPDNVATTYTCGLCPTSLTLKTAAERCQPFDTPAVRATQGERLLTQRVATPFVLSALRSKVYRSMSGVVTAVFRLIAMWLNSMELRREIAMKR